MVFSSRNDKLVLKVAYETETTVLSLSQFGPTYLSMDLEEGKKHCLMFFPEDYVLGSESPEEFPDPPAAVDSE